MRLEVPVERVLYTPWWDINWFPKALQKTWRRLLGRRSDSDLWIKSISAPRLSMTWAAVVGLREPDRFALGATIGRPTAFSMAWAVG